MGYFDGLVSGSFKQDDTGRTLFFPYGFLGKGKLSPSDDAAQSLKSSLKIYYMIALPVIIVVSIAAGFLVSLAAAAVLMVLYEIWIRSKTSGWAQSGARLTYAESSGNSAMALGKGLLILLLVCSLIFVVAGAAMAIIQPEARLMGILSSLFFGVCALAFINMLWRRSQKL
jgi:hypothetical protein